MNHDDRMTDPQVAYPDEIEEPSRSKEHRA